MHASDLCVDFARSQRPTCRPDLRTYQGRGSASRAPDFHHQLGYGVSFLFAEALEEVGAVDAWTH